MNSVAIVGAGALGILFGWQLQRCCGAERVFFPMDAERYERHSRETYSVNGEPAALHLVRAEDCPKVDLVLVATKDAGLRGAMEVMAPAVGEHTLILSVLNGILSEELLAERFGPERVAGCVALGMDAMRQGTALTWSRPGRLQLGALLPEQTDAVAGAAAFLRGAGIAVEEVDDIRRALWSKFMLNVGINQTCMVYNVPYGPALHTQPCRADLEAVMREAIAVARAEGVGLTETDMDKAIALIDTLDPAASPSMRQDLLARRPSEVALFAGTVLRYAAKHGIPVPVNRRYADRIRGIEAGY